MKLLEESFLFNLFDIFERVKYRFLFKFATFLVRCVYFLCLLYILLILQQLKCSQFLLLLICLKVLTRIRMFKAHRSKKIAHQINIKDSSQLLQFYN